MLCLRRPRLFLSTQAYIITPRAWRRLPRAWGGGRAWGRRGLCGFTASISAEQRGASPGEVLHQKKRMVSALFAGLAAVKGAGTRYERVSSLAVRLTPPPKRSRNSLDYFFLKCYGSFSGKFCAATRVHFGPYKDEQFVY